MNDFLTTCNNALLSCRNISSLQNIIITQHIMYSTCIMKWNYCLNVTPAVSVVRFLAQSPTVQYNTFTTNHIFLLNKQLWTETIVLFSSSSIFIFFVKKFWVGFSYIYSDYNIENWVWTRTLAALCCMQSLALLHHGRTFISLVAHHSRNAKVRT